MLIEKPFMSAIFGLFTQFTINAHMTIYRNLTPNITKGQKKGKMVPKQVQNDKKFKKLVEIPFYDYDFLYNTHKPYRIHYFNYTHVIRGH